MEITSFREIFHFSFQNMTELSVHSIDIVPDQNHAKHEEAKVSSSSTRARLLGKLLQPPKVC